MRTKKIMNLVCSLSFLLYSAGVFAQGTVTGTVADELKLSMLVKNLFDGANTRQLVVGGQNTDAGLIEKQANPTGVGRLTSAVLQNPKRVLFTNRIFILIKAISLS